MRRFALLVTAVTVLPLASCGTGEPSSAPSPASAKQQAKQRVEEAVLTAEQLPPKWKPARVEDHIEDPGLPTYCGVTVLPKPLGAGRVDLYARTSTGPFLLQYTSVAPDEAGAKEVMAKLTKAAPTCRSDTNGKARYEVRPVTDIADVGDEAVGFHYESQSGYTSGIVVFRRGDMLVTLLDIGPPALPYETVRSVAGTIDEQVA